MQKIGKFLNPLIKKKMGAAHYNEVLIKHYWVDIIGQELADKCIPVRVEKNTLTILSESSTLNHHLLTIQNKLIEQINNFIQTKFIKSLFFINGRLKDFEWSLLEKKQVELTDLRKSLKKIKLDDQSLNGVNELTKSVVNNDLREKLNQVLITNKKYRQLLIERGHKKCSSCELLVDNSVDKCFFCAQLEKEKLCKHLKTIFQEVPYIDFSECQNYVKCDRILFNDVKNQIIDNLIRKIKMNKYTKKDVLVYAMLTSGENAMNLTPPDLDKLCEQIKSRK